MRTPHYLMLLSMLLASPLTPASAANDGQHLFILSGQSNMARMNPDVVFTPRIKRAFGNDKVIVVKHAKGGEPIRRWVHDWTSRDGDRPDDNGELYDQLIKQVRASIDGQTIASISLLWMQGESDGMQHGEVYHHSLETLLQQLRSDLGRDDIYYVIGRISDHGVNHASYPDWNLVRQAQMDIAEASPRGAWLNTDDLNDGLNRRGRRVQNDLHYTIRGYRLFGMRLADQAIELIRQNAL